jgi:endonuclease/exonuclease/phosphatase family metal-dependent hydrolase
MSSNRDNPPSRRSHTISILTYNVHSCIGTDRKIDPYRTADVIAQTGADIIALQELDVGRKRTGGMDQAHVIASLLKMEAHFHPALHVEDEKYGDAILTAFPTRLVKAGPLPSLGELRGAIWVRVDLPGLALNVLNTHLGLSNFDRMQQVSTLLGSDWMGRREFQDIPTVICGDLNAVPSSAAYKALAACFRDVQRVAPTRAARTFPSRFPFLRLDHIFVSKEIGIVRSQVISTAASRRASDHLPVLAEIEFPPCPG